MYIKFWITIIGLCCLAMALKGCDLVDLPETVTKPAVAEAAKEEILKVDICKIGGYSVSKYEILQIGQEK